MPFLFSPKSISLLGLAFILLGAGCTKKAATPTPPPTPPGFAVETVVDGLEAPVAAAFAPDGRIFITEKKGTIRVVKNGVLLAAPLITLPDVNVHADHGLLGLAVDPDFAHNGFIYMSYTYENNPADPTGPKTGRIARLTVIDDRADPASYMILVGKEAGNPQRASCSHFPPVADCIVGDAGSHNVGGLRFGPDGKLYASLGDGAKFDGPDQRAMGALNPDILAGKILRLNPDGTGPADNPFYNGDPNANRSKVYALGVRNSFRFNFRPINNQLYLGEVGWYATDEINLGKPGANYGWPCREGLLSTDHYKCSQPEAIDPLYPITNQHTPTSTFAVMGGAFSGDAYPEPYRDNYFFGIFGKDHIQRMVFDKENKIIMPHYDFILGADGPVDFLTGPDGNVYFVSLYAGELRRLTYSDNRPPMVHLKASTLSGPAPLVINFSSAGTRDILNYPLNYYWDFGDYTTSSLPDPQHVYLENGTYTVTLTATNDHGASAKKQLIVKVGEDTQQAGSGAYPELVQTRITPHESVVGNVVNVTAVVNNTGAADPILVNIEISDRSGKKRAQQYYDNIVINSGEQQSFGMSWIAEEPGEYIVSVGLHDAGWKTQKKWIANALTFTVGSRSPGI